VARSQARTAPDSGVDAGPTINDDGIEGTPYITSGIITQNTAPLKLGRGRDNLYNINGILRWVQIFDVVIL